MTMAHAFLAAGFSTEARGANLLDTGAHFYEVYETSDGRYVAVGAIEPRFYAALLDGLNMDQRELPHQMDRDSWPQMKERFAAAFALKTRDEWTTHFEGTEACVAPVLSPLEAMDHPHNVARGTFVEVGGVRQPGPAPRFSRTPSAVASPPEQPGRSTTSALRRWGIDRGRVDALLASGALGGR
jgi:alpha-methylacyl-CoA racemase